MGSINLRPSTMGAAHLAHTAHPPHGEAVQVDTGLTRLAVAL